MDPSRSTGASRDNGGAAPTGPQATRKRGKRGGRRRGTAAGVARRINAKARERQEAWLEGGRPNDTYRLTRKLDELYDEHREQQAARTR